MLFVVFDLAFIPWACKGNSDRVKIDPIITVNRKSSDVA